MTSLPGLAALVFVAVTCIVLGDTAGKLLTQAGVAPIFVAWSRFVLGAAMILPLVRPSLPEWRSLANRWLFLRAALVAGGIASILTALSTEPIANVFGAFFVGPIVSFVLATLFLGERPSLLRGVLLAVGFLGVMLVVKPGFGVSPGMFFALLAGLLYGGFLAVTRALAGQHRAGFLLCSQLVIGSLLLTPLGLSVAIPDLATPVILLLLASAAGSAAGNFMLVVANRRAEASLIAPLIYTQLISATGASILVFRDWPDALTLVGLTLILASGLGSLWSVRVPRGGSDPSNT